MMKFRTVAVSLIFAAIFAVSTAAQTTNLKIGIIDPRAWGAQGGITKFINAYGGLEKEFAPITNELKTMATRKDTLEKELKVLQDQINARVPINEASARAKNDEYTNLSKQITRKQEDAKAQAEKREAEVLSPILDDIQKALQEYSNKNGYDLIFDATKIEQILFAGNAAKMDVTKDFITFYNARPAATASTATRP